MAQLLNQAIHVRYNGRSQELAPGELHIRRDATDEQIKHALTNYLDLPVSALRHHVVVRNSQTIVIRPEAVYG